MLTKLFSITTEERKNKKHIVIKFLFLKFKFKQKKADYVAILDCGGVGDYVFIRPYFKYFKESELFKNKKLIYFSKACYENIIKTFDNNFFHDVIVYDSKNKKNLNEKLKKYKFDSLVNLLTLEKTNLYRGWLPRYNLSKKIKAKNKYADYVIDNDYNERLDLSKKIYNKPIYTQVGIFEQERRHQFFQKLFQKSLPIEPLAIPSLIDFRKDIICISIRSNVKNKDYSNENWISVIKYLIENTSNDTQIVLIGAAKDCKHIKKLMQKLPEKVINLSGKIDVTILPSILKISKLLIAPETGTIHLAHAVGCPAICLCCGAYYGRFLPYQNSVDYIFPDEFDKIIQENDQAKIIKFYNRNWGFSVNDIPPQKVIKVLDKYLGKDTCV